MRLLSMVLPLMLIAASAPPADPPPAHRVMTFNIRCGPAEDGLNHWEKRKDLVVEVIRRTRPLVVATQEGYRFQWTYVLEKLPHYGLFGQGRLGGDENEMSAILYDTRRLRLREGGDFWLSETPERVSQGWDGSLPRMCTWAYLEFLKPAPGEALGFYFFSTHFDHRGATARLKSAELIRERARRLPRRAPVVVGGDFNCGAGSDPYAALTAEGLLGDLARRVERVDGPEGTYHGFKGGAPAGPAIDWLLATSDVSARRVWVETFQRAGRCPSDHYPVVAEVSFPMRPGS
jgi:endonuclease/exonuclease/phosphatase family metal-dependent hydrolase